MEDDIRFGCTECGRCCHGLKLPLTALEAVGWLARGHQVQVLCEAVPWPTEPAASDLQAQHKRRRSFETRSGSLPARVVVILAASFGDACPNLGPDAKCTIYERRPLVCRIYPAEISPFIRLDPTAKVCPAEAWSSDRPLLMRGGMLMDADVREYIRRSREADEAEVQLKATVCALLGYDNAAMANEGFVVYSPDAAQLLQALEMALTRDQQPAAASPWRFVSNQRATTEALAEVGASTVRAGAGVACGFEYLGFRAATA